MSAARAARTACAIALVLSIAGLGSGCVSEPLRSLGNIDSSSDARAGQRDEKDENHERADKDSTSPWDTLRESSEPYWVRDDPLEAAADVRPASIGSDKAESSEGQDAKATGLLMAVDRQHGLPPDYTPDDLEFVQPLGIPTLGGGSMRLREDAAGATSTMLEEAREGGVDLVLCSAYRSYDDQVVSYGRLTNIYGEEAEAFVAPPGHSEHQLGTVIDLSNPAADCDLVQGFADTRASEWLRQNALDYGFVLSYPQYAEDHTGYSWEPWHYRFIGKENAARYEEGDYESPQQFFLEQGVLPQG